MIANRSDRNSQNLQNRQRSEISKKIEDLSSRLPSTILLKYANTQHLLESWFEQRNFAIYFGKLLKAKFGGGGGNPALAAWQAGEIDEIDYKCLIYLADFYNSLFGLIQSSWQFIQLELSHLSQQVATNYPGSETQYFLWLIQEEFDNHYRKSLNGYCFKIKDFEQEAKILRNTCWKPKLDSQDIEKLKSLPCEKGLPKSFYLHFVLVTATKYSAIDSTLSDKLGDLNRHIARLGDLVSKACRQERKPEPPKRLISHKVEKGELFVGAKGAGWKPFVTKT
ncbi:MAG: hypothetical protein KME32_33900 [Mojavia pulchra JT2-VF2]|jgi:hypothetical protein|uniref:Uncharacterized protein n=1 Tax=Mojavia pulchra JT2-VF2 TaxID=287848 RepID=A0A951Q7H6_9NOST|nr:hypothetical protein [Mojavia pulchra JT2-VF2]